MIDKVYDLLIRKYTEMGILAPDEEVLRGETTIRLHVKKYKALISIEAALESVEAVDKVTIKRISIPLSMKNEFQKKGFLVYVQVSDIKEVPIAQSVLRQFEVFRKCEVAPQTAEFAKSNVKKSPTPIVSNKQSQASKETSSKNILFEEEAIVVPSVFPRAKAGY
jgi:exosome complex RNA-binding protein Csl4